jgi:hypothetical protein
MQTSDLALSAGGGLTLRQWTITYVDLQGISGSGAQNLKLVLSSSGPTPQQYVLPQAATILFSRVNVTTAFAGGAISALTMSVGTSGSTTAITGANSIFATGCFDKHGLNSEFNADNPQSLIVTLTPTSDVLANATAGSLTLTLLIVGVSTPVVTANVAP